jgi:hypothetical protein
MTSHYKGLCTSPCSALRESSLLIRTGKTVSRHTGSSAALRSLDNAVSSWCRQERVAIAMGAAKPDSQTTAAVSLESSLPGRQCYGL